MRERLLLSFVSKVDREMKLHLFDIEGTIAPITFVHDVLFPYSVQKVDAFLTANPDEVNDVITFL